MFQRAIPPQPQARPAINITQINTAGLGPKNEAPFIQDSKLTAEKQRTAAGKIEPP